jgi:predicted dehydrogenase
MNVQTKTNPIGIGVVGYGPMAQVHFRHLQIHPYFRSRVKVLAAFDPNPEIQTKIAGHGLQAPNTFEDFLNLPELDAIVISSPPQFHAQQVIAGLEAGKHVFSEVPMALTKEDIDRIIAAEERSPKVKYQYGENYCFFPEVLYAAHLVDTNKLGSVVYGESEYLHDVTYRWRQGQKGGPETPRVESWYSKFDPLAYAHSIGPAEIAMGGRKNPMEFVEVQSYANDIGAIEVPNSPPICAPSHAFHVALFKSATGAVAKCANAYVFAREPTRLIIQVTGELGTYECYKIGGSGQLFLADGHMIVHKHRAGVKRKIGRWQIAKALPEKWTALQGSNQLLMKNWIDAIITDTAPLLNAKVGANMCMAGIAAQQAARTGKAVSIPEYRAKK